MNDNFLNNKKTLETDKKISVDVIRIYENIRAYFYKKKISKLDLRLKNKEITWENYKNLYEKLLKDWNYE